MRANLGSSAFFYIGRLTKRPGHLLVSAFLLFALSHSESQMNFINGLSLNDRLICGTLSPTHLGAPF